MRIFTDVQRTDLGPAAHTESRYAYYNRSARPEVGRIRRLLESWFQGYPEQHQLELQRRFVVDFDAAFFELFLHQLLLASGYDVTVHPPIAGTANSPDFLARRGTDSFYLEATVATDQSAEQRALDAVEAGLYDAVNSVDSPNLFLRLRRLDLEKGAQPAARRIKAFLERHLEHADPDDLTTVLREDGIDAMPSWVFEDEGIRLEIQPIPKSEQARGKPNYRNIGIYPFRSRWGGVQPALRNAVSEKATRYGVPDRPFVIGVDSISEWGTDRTEVMEALFGTEHYHIRPGDPEPGMSRGTDGVFSGPKGPQNTRVSAVLVATVIAPNLASAPVEIYHNPWASKPVGPDILPVTQAVPESGTVRWMSGQSMHRILGLDEDWPKSEGGTA